MPSESVSEDTGSEEPTSSSVMPVNRLITSVLARSPNEPWGSLIPSEELNSHVVKFSGRFSEEDHAPPTKISVLR